MSRKNYSKGAVKLAVLGFLCFVLLIIMAVTGRRHSGTYGITITAPSDENGPVTPGHGFFIAGDTLSPSPIFQSDRYRFFQ